ncbi:hypothetical protein FBU59_000598 [Linderina macrospora]|uniref:Uncharacterized protein n=1 Tax=Linderina macrospora TaxID=4868 RepID=A0ACC1JG76_9FUNG|nr:hypothetical protein FBU59_000598 [Linderina macrospora]
MPMLHLRHSQKSKSEDDSDSDFDADEPVFVPEEQYVPLDDEYEPLGDEGSNGGNGDDSESVDVDINIEREIEARMHQELFSDLDTSSAVDEPASQAAPAAQLPQMARQIRPLEVDVAHGSRMTADHVDQIKGIMAGIHISNHGIPEWAKIVPESAWMPKRKPSSDGDSAGSGEKR